MEGNNDYAHKGYTFIVLPHISVVCDGFDVNIPNKMHQQKFVKRRQRTMTKHEWVQLNLCPIDRPLSISLGELLFLLNVVSTHIVGIE